MTETTKYPLKDLYNEPRIKDIYNGSPIKDIYPDYVTNVPSPLDEPTNIFTPHKNIYDLVTHLPQDIDNLTPDFNVRKYIINLD